MKLRRLRLSLAIACGLSGAVMLGIIGAFIAALTGPTPLAGLIAGAAVGFCCGAIGALAVL